MKYVTLIVLLAMSVGTALAAAQGPPPKPTPAPEMRKLDYFVGTWKTEGELKPSPMGPGGKFTDVSHNDWLPGHFFLVLHSSGNGPLGHTVETGYMGYSTEDKAYTYDAFSNISGEADHAKGNVEGDTWTWTSTEKMGGKAMKGRFTITVASPTAYSFKFEMAPEGGGDYTTVVEGKATKVAAAKMSAAAGTKK